MPTKNISSLCGILLGLVFCLGPAASAEKGGKPAAAGQKTFASPEAAAQALLTAAEADNATDIMLLFGPAGKDVLSSGDPVQDKKYHAAFVAKAKTSMKLEKDPINPNRVVIAIGEDDFPFAIPLLRAADSQWHFDMEEGRFEVMARRVGSNELDAIAVCSGYVEAQIEYATEDRNHNNVYEYARKFISSPGKQDGLYWPQTPNAPASPISAGIIKAAAEGYKMTGDKPTPYHGYYFKILTAQGPDAAGGARDYLQQGLMIAGFGLVAWPAEYGVSGIKTFQVNQDGVIFDKDLGPQTEKAAQAITKFNPDKSWTALR